MHVRKRNGELQPVDLTKIVTSLKRYCDLANVDVYKIATKKKLKKLNTIETM